MPVSVMKRSAFELKKREDELPLHEISRRIAFNAGRATSSIELAAPIADSDAVSVNLEGRATLARARWKYQHGRDAPLRPQPRTRCHGSIRFSALALVFISTLIAVASALWLPLPLLEALTIENGPIENGTVMLYGFAIAAVWMARNPAFGRTAATASTVILICCVARETSLRRWLIQAGETSFCCTREIVATLSAVLVLLLIASVAWLTVRYRAWLWHAIRRRNPSAATLLVLFCTLVGSQAMDKLPGMLQRAGISMAPSAQWVALSIEEILEMILPVLVVMAAWQARRSARSPRE